MLYFFSKSRRNRSTLFSIKQSPLKPKKSFKLNLIFTALCILKLYNDFLLLFATRQIGWSFNGVLPVFLLHSGLQEPEVTKHPGANLVSQLLEHDRIADTGMQIALRMN